MKEYKFYTIEESQKQLKIDYQQQTTLFYSITFIILFLYSLGIFILSSNNRFEEITVFTIMIIILLSLFTFLEIYFLAWSFLVKKELLLKQTGVEYNKILKNNLKSTLYLWSEIKEFKLLSDNKLNYSIELINKKNRNHNISNGMDKLEAQRILFKLNTYRNKFVNSTEESSFKISGKAKKVYSIENETLAQELIQVLKKDHIDAYSQKSINPMFSSTGLPELDIFIKDAQKEYQALEIIKKHVKESD